ncbi:MAG: LysR family transcriptional regulator [Rhodospirillaceae bacterium]
MDLQWFKDLASLARTGNFSRAAGLNNISQSAFSRRIQALEDWVGTPLVDRTRHPIALTQAGEQMLEASEQAIARVETERAQIQGSLSQPDKYVVTFAAQHSIGWWYYLAWLQAFEKSFGPLISRLLADNLPNCISALERGEADFVMSYGSRYASGVEDRPHFEHLIIGRDRLIPVAKAGADGDPLFRIEEDATHAVPYLRFGPTAPIGWHIEPVIKERNLAPRLNTVYENSMGGALRIRAREGLGMAWLPQSLVEPDLQTGLLAWAGGEDWTIDLEIRLHRAQNNPNTLIRDIWDYLKGREGDPLLP